MAGAVSLTGCRGTAGDGIIIILRASDNGRSIGPFPAGEYQASLFVEAFRASPARQVVRIGAKQTASIAFQLLPEGSITGNIQQQFYDDGDPAGIFLKPDRDIKIRSIRLRGEGKTRTLVPVAQQSL